MKKSILGIVIASLIILLICIVAIGKDSSISPFVRKEKIKIAALKGPTGFGMSKLYNDDKYDIQIFGSPDEVVAKVINKEVDIAALPTNVASILYNKTNKKIKILAINNLSNLYVVTNDNKINELGDLSGKNILLSGVGATPDAIMQCFIKSGNLKDVTIDYKSEHAEVALLLASKKADVGILPEPFVTSFLDKATNGRIALDITNEWKKIKNSELPMGCIIATDEARNRFGNRINSFLDDYKDSIEFTNSNAEKASEIIEKYGIVENKKIALSAIPRCNICFITNDEMKQSLKSYFNTLSEFSNEIIGGSIPDEKIYYQYK